MTPDAALPRIIISTGEPAGVGPDVTVQIAQRELPADVVAVGNAGVLQERAVALSLPLALSLFDAASRVPHRPGKLRLINVPTAAACAAGRPDPANAEYVLNTLRAACEVCLGDARAALVTAPVQKSIINAAGTAFSGHTEFLATLCAAATPVMLLANQVLKVALITTHLPLSKVTAAITGARLTAVLRVIDDDLRAKFGIARPRILVCGLNPHAGEGGYLGREDDEIIAPVIRTLNAQGLVLTGPHPADTAFTPAMLRRFDVFVSMYHDQGLPVVKALGFGATVNVTLGLPIIRTSVDHGVALDLAASGKASSSSLLCAIEYALAMLHNTGKAPDDESAFLRRVR